MAPDGQDAMARVGSARVGREAGFFGALVGDGRPLLAFTGVALILAGAFALFLAARGEFLPHDEAYLGMSADELCTYDDCRIVHFMFHDRVAFGGALIAIGTLYLWLVEFPLRRGEGWAWWALAASGAFGFASFLTYLGYGYLDDWHGAVTLVLLPCFGVGLARTRRLIQGAGDVWSIFLPAVSASWRSRYGMGRLLLILTGAGMVAAGLTISTFGMTRVFVPQDLTYMDLPGREAFDAISPRLVPLIAHDRAGFGGAIGTAGVLAACCAWCGHPSRALWQALAMSGMAGFVTAIVIHPIVGYNDLGHVAPAIAGAMLFTTGMVLTYPEMHRFVRPQEATEGVA